MENLLKNKQNKLITSWDGNRVKNTFHIRLIISNVPTRIFSNMKKVEKMLIMRLVANLPISKHSNTTTTTTTTTNNNNKI